MTEANTIELPIKLGFRYWTPSNGHMTRVMECPDCCGTKFVTMILGNGERFEIDCNRCQSGFDPPTGKVTVTYWESKPEPFVPRSFSVEHSVFKFSDRSPGANTYCSVEVDKIFMAREECLALCEAINAEHNKDEERRALANLQNNRRKASFEVSYWKSQRTKLRADLERIERRLRECEEKKSGQATNQIA